MAEAVGRRRGGPARRVLDPGAAVLVRKDSAFYAPQPLCTPLARRCRSRPGWTSESKTTIARIAEDAWTRIEYTDRVFDDTSGQWISRAEVTETDFVAFAAQPKADQVPGRLDRPPDPLLRAGTNTAPPGKTACSAYGDSTRSSPPPTPTSSTPWPRTRSSVGAPVIEQVHADLKASALGAPALRRVHRQRRLARARGDRAQSHPRRRDPETTDLARATAAMVRRTSSRSCAGSQPQRGG